MEKEKTKAETLDILYNELSAYGKKLSASSSNNFTENVVAMARRDTIFIIPDWLEKAMREAWDEEMREILSKKKAGERKV